MLADFQICISVNCNTNSENTKKIQVLVINQIKTKDSLIVQPIRLLHYVKLKLLFCTKSK